MKTFLLKSTIFLSIFAFAVSCMPITGIATQKNGDSIDELSASTSLVLKTEKNSRSLDNTSAILNGNVSLLSSHKDKKDVLLVNGKGTVSYVFSLPESGQYILQFTYFLSDLTNRKVELGATLNEDKKYSGNQLCLPRVFEDEKQSSNEIKPKQLTVNQYVTSEIRIDDHRRGEYLYFGFVTGKNTLTFTFDDQNVYIGNIELLEQKKPVSYVPPTQVVEGAACIVIEGEAAKNKSDSVLSPTYDLDPQTSPESTKNVEIGRAHV